MVSGSRVASAAGSQGRVARFNAPRAARVEANASGCPRRGQPPGGRVSPRGVARRRPLVDGGAGRPPLLRARPRNRREHRRLPRQRRRRLVYSARRMSDFDEIEREEIAVQFVRVPDGLRAHPPRLGRARGRRRAARPALLRRVRSRRRRLPRLRRGPGGRRARATGSSPGRCPAAATSARGCPASRRRCTSGSARRSTRWRGERRRT